MDEQQNLQVAKPLAGPQPGSEANQTDESARIEQPGAQPQASEETPETTTETPESTATSTPAKAPQTKYTDDDMRQFQAVKDREVAQAQQAAERLAMEKYIDQARAQEQAAQHRDRQAVESGTITEGDANTRRQARYEQATLALNIATQRAQVGQMAQEADNYARIRVAFDLGMRHGIDPNTLLFDPKIQTATQMVEKAAEMGNQRLKEQLRAARQKGETYDKGRSGGASGTGFSGTVTQSQLEDPSYWGANKTAILKAQREGRLVVKE